jgi:hypothetical protein
VTNIQDFNPFGPPDLTHTKVLSASINGDSLQPGEIHWNGILNATLRLVMRSEPSYDELRRLITINFIVGIKQDEGYRLVEGTGLSVQGQDSNAAWQAVSHISRQIGCSVNVVFVWRQNESAAFPGKTAQFRIAGTTE